MKYQVNSTRKTMTTLLGFTATIVLFVTLINPSMAAPTVLDMDSQDGLRYKRSSPSVVEIENPREVLRVLDMIASAIIDSQAAQLAAGGNNGVLFAAEKRGIDLGMNRGFSGRQAARHLVGLASAQFAGGPGKRR